MDVQEVLAAQTPAPPPGLISDELFQGKKYALDRSYQMGLVALLLRDPGFLARAIDTIHPKFFEYEDLEIISKLVLDYHKCYHGQCPLAALVRAYLKRFPGQDALSQILPATVEVLELMPLPNQDWMFDTIVLFAQRQGVVRAVRNALGVIGDEANISLEKLGSIPRYFDEALSVGTGREDDGFFVDSVLDELPARLHSEVRAKRHRTGFREVDLCLRGGLGAGEAGVILGPSGLGKSMCMQSMAMFDAMGDTELLLAGESNAVGVFYSTHELNQWNVTGRIIANLFDIPVDELENPTSEEQSALYRSRLAWIRENLGFGTRCGRMFVQYYAAGEASVSTLRSKLSYLRMKHDFRPKVVFVDYADELSRDMKARADNSYFDLGEIVQDLIRLGRDFDCAVWTGSQTNRAGTEKALSGNDVCGMSDIGDSAKKIFKARVVISLNQSPIEKMQGAMRAFICKANNGEAHRIIDLIQNPRTMRIIENPHQFSHQKRFGGHQAENHNGKKKKPEPLLPVNGAIHA